MVTTTLKLNQKVEECDRGRGGNIEHSVKEPYGNSHTARATPSWEASLYIYNIATRIFTTEDFGLLCSTNSEDIIQMDILKLPRGPHHGIVALY